METCPANTAANRQEIIRAAAYRPSDHSYVLKYKPSELTTANQFLQTSHLTISPVATAADTRPRATTTPTWTTGTLSVLPTEIALQVLSYLDLRSFLSFRQVSRHARMLASDVPEYKAAATHASTYILALLRTELAPRTTFTEVIEAMKDIWCIECGALADFVYIPTRSRICRDCIAYNSSRHHRDAADLQVTAFTTVWLDQLYFYAYSIDQPGSWDECDELLRTTLPVAKYGPRFHRREYVNLAQAQQAATLPDIEKLDFAEITGPDGLRPLVVEPVAKFCCRLPFLDCETRQVSVSLACAGCAVEAKELKDSGPTGRGEWWQADWWRWHFATEDDFMGHFAGCVAAQEIWQRKVDGDTTVESEVTAARYDIWSCS